MVLLITGATGHVGEHVARLAGARGMKAVALFRGAEMPEAIDGVTWVPGDLGDVEGLERIGREHRVTACVHGAAVSNEAYARPDPLGAVATNVMATANLLDLARKLEWKRLVLVSTGSVFQKRAMTGKPIPEDAQPEPENIYSTTKTAAESLVRMYRSEFDLSASTVRISWVYGPPVISKDATRGPIPSFLIRALKSEVINEGGADFAASFTHVKDVATGLLAMATASELTHPVYHLGHRVNFSLGQVAAAIQQAVPGAQIALSPGTDPWTRYTALRDPLGGSKLLEDCNFEPTINLDDGIADYANWLRENRKLWE